MASIYLHIPFCKQACYYCDFHFSTSLKNKGAFLQAVKTELKLQEKFFSAFPKKDQIIRSIYFGGGTPSLVLDKEELQQIIEIIQNTFTVCDTPEITLEANPDDLTNDYLTDLKNTHVNRLSIGIQSFNDKDLEFLNRSHDSKQAFNAVKQASDRGFMNTSVDLIYGIPASSLAVWQDNLGAIESLSIKHLSCYCLTIEPKTVFGNWIKAKKLIEATDTEIEDQFNYLIKWSLQNDFEHYEISNFCKAKCYSVHNTSYWKNEPYLGIGPSAHSYNLNKRFWNVANNSVYIQSLADDRVPNESEVLSVKNQFNEYVMTGLRTKWGIDLSKIKSRFGMSFVSHSYNSANQFLLDNYLEQSDDFIYVTDKGKLISDKIITSFIMSEE